MNKRNIGSLYEEKAVEYLKNNGFTVIVKNFRCPKGEIDIIAIKEDILRFIEVKYRKNTEYGYAKEAVNKTKMNKIRQCGLLPVIRYIQTPSAVLM